ncbi:EAL domain-containing protein [Vibrio syngnathi]|uniref:EAL domain-containing protein n=2 Tax=Vibrio syngnathi TaxID=3034029 RepID=A0AA34XM90_9VIBR|nr:EAL domain-containing protein [Vibrio syngnathi]
MNLLTFNRKMKENKLVYLIRYIPTITVVLFSIIVFSLSVNDSYRRTNQEITHIESDIVEEKKAYLKSQVSYVNKQLNYLEETTITTLRDSIKTHTLRIHSILNQLHTDNPQLSEQEFTTLVHSSLKNYRFNDGRGYPFIYHHDGTVIFHPIFPSSQGASRWDYKDAKGHFIAQELTKKAIEEKEGFHKWWFIKPNTFAKQYEKIGYIVNFSPYNWYIGTSDFITDVQSDIQNNVLEWLSQLQLGQQSNFYVIDTKGDVLAHTTPSFIGTNIHNIKNIHFRTQAVTLLEQSDVYVRHLAADNHSLENLSYVVKNSTWGWTIGASFSVTALERLVAKKNAELIEKRNDELNRLALMYSIVVLLVGLLSYYVSTLVSRRFESYQAEIQSDFEKLNTANSTLNHFANHDQLTGLFNRHFFEVYMEKELAKTQSDDDKFLVCFIDVDNFKNINDYYGHSVGDELLIQISQTLKKVCPNFSEVFRFGGDEFIVTFPDLNSLKQAESVMKLFHDELATKYQCFEHEFDISFSLGAAVYPDHGRTVDELLASSDIMLHFVKSEGKANCAIFSSKTSAKNQRKFLIEDNLLAAIEKKEIYLDYQPQYCLQSGRLWGIEALARWKSPTLGNVYPDEFISVAEVSGHIRALSWYLIELAYQQYSELDFPDNAPILLALNLSPVQIGDTNFAENIIKITERYGINPSHICLEATEGIMLKNPEEVAKVAYQLRSKGFHLALDDFGTGYSSLKYLSLLPIHEIKIDRSFIWQLSESNTAHELLKSIVAIGRSTGTRTVAEGVETIEQLEYVKQYGCDIVQGYLFSKPVPLEEAVQIRQYDLEKMESISN